MALGAACQNGEKGLAKNGNEENWFGQGKTTQFNETMGQKNMKAKRT